MDSPSTTTPGRAARRLAAACSLLVVASAAAGLPIAAESETPTFTRDVAPILYEHCATCHRPGESAPFDLLTYADALKHDRQIAMVTARRFMPPWLPERGLVAFTGERGLSEREIDLLRRWYEAGAPEGDPQELPPLPRWAEGWQLGAPDLVLEPDETYTLPADGIDVFRNLIIPIPIDRSRYVRTIDLRPENPRVAHHAVMRVDRSRSSRLLDQQDPEAGYEGMEWGEARPPEGHFLGWTPGKVPYAGSDDLAWVLEPGSDLVVQMHMVPSGKPEAIRPKVGIYFAESPPTRSTETIVLDVKQIDIPPGKRDYVVEESYVLPVAVEIVSIYPHAHYLGKKLEGWAELPDGSRQWLVRIPDWDFNWQDQYRFAEPVRLPAGAKVALRYVYDNSADNVRNPNIPPQRVVLGNRSTDEMGSMSFEVLLASDRDRWTLREALIRQDLARWPDYWIAHGLLGSLLLDTDRPQEAVRHLQRAVRINPEYAVGYNNLGTALSRSGMQQPAAMNFQRALELRPQFADAHYNLAVHLASAGLLEQAIEHYREALDVRAHDPDFHNNLGVALAMIGQSDEAIVHFRRALELAPDSDPARVNLGNLLMEEGWYFAAIEHYRQALAGLPDSEDLQSNLRLAMEVVAETESQIEGLESAVQSGRVDAYLLGDLANLYASTGRYEEAMRTARRAVDTAKNAGASDLAETLGLRLQAIEALAER